MATEERTDEWDGDEETPLQEMVSGAIVGLTLLTGFALMFAGVGFFWVVFVVGFAGVLPMALGGVELYERKRRRDAAAARKSEREDALETLRRRYATGELTDEEFERRLERLLSTESLDEASAYVERAGTDRSDDREPAYETN
ncbi:SHOCT domain-containing protein [Halovivax gelatinilyticus]|uniref:SHOCT domain-containing protein n=1 Tax=Halovivax gelatinilyticus TaxID=2961597 RepID=UPI0020CA4F5F|nr:SHOCT domain-containing protein [Halovivax gelatinilyticus]